MIPSTVKELCLVGHLEKGREDAGNGMLLLQHLCGSYGERGIEELEGVEKHFIHLRNSLFFLISFWCTHRIPTCTDEWVSFVENHVLYKVFYFRYMGKLFAIF